MQIFVPSVLRVQLFQVYYIMSSGTESFNKDLCLYCAISWSDKQYLFSFIQVLIKFKYDQIHDS